MNYSIIFVMTVPLVCLLFTMVLSMPETFIEPVKATLLGLFMVGRK